MNPRKFELMEQYLKGEYTVSDLIDRIAEVENKLNQPRVKQTSYEIKEYLFCRVSDANQVLQNLLEYFDQHETVAVADYYDLIGVIPSLGDYTYGWTIDSITKATILPVRGGYIIKFPPTEVI